MRKFIIPNALFWAALIILTALFLKDHSFYVYIFGAEIVLAGFINAILTKPSNRNCKTSTNLS